MAFFTQHRLAVAALSIIATGFFLASCSSNNALDTTQGTITLITDDSMPESCHLDAVSKTYVYNKDRKPLPCPVKNPKYIHMTTVPSAVTIDFREYKGSGAGECDPSQPLQFSIVFKTRGTYTTSREYLSINELLQEAEAGLTADKNLQVIQVTRDPSMGNTYNYLANLDCIIVQDAN